MKNIKISIVYVNYYSSENLYKSITSVFKDNFNNYEIIVINNGDKENVHKKLLKFKNKIRFIQNSKNNGYGAGNNLGSRLAKGKYLFFLNPDTEVKKGCLQNLFKFLESHKEVAAVAPNLLDEDGRTLRRIGSQKLTPIRAIFSLSIINKLFPNNPIAKKYYLDDLDKNKIRQVDAVPGSAFLIRKNIFSEIGGFDENMFMYFEESDLGNRTESLGFKLFILPIAKVIHKTEQEKDEKLKSYFEKSRNYYFKKYYGSFNASIVEFFCKLSRLDVLFFLLLIFGICLRLFRAQSHFILDSEIADNLLDIKNSYISGKVPLVGPPTSHPWLQFGPLFYWIYSPILIASKFNPLSYLYFGIIFNILPILINYIFVKHFWNKKIALLSSLIIGISPYLLGYANSVRFYTYVLTFSYLTVFLLMRFLNSKKGLYLLFFSIGILLNFHYSVLVIVPAILILIYLNKIKLSSKVIFLAIAGLFLPFIPLFIYDSKNGFSMSKNLLLWLPYRVLNVIGIIHEGNIQKGSLILGVKSLFDFFADIISSSQISVFYIYSAIIVLALILLLVLNYKKLNRDTKNLLILSVSCLLLLTIHGDTPNHYFLFISPFVIILLSISILKYYKIKIFRYLLFLLFLVSIINLVNFINNKIKNPSINYFQQKEIAKYIYSDSQQQPIWIRRVGENDKFDGDFAQNYDYLLWLEGNEPVKLGNEVITKTAPNIEYIIVDGVGYSTNNGKLLIYFPNTQIKIYKIDL